MNAMLQPQFESKIHHPAAPRYFDRDAETMPRGELERLQLRRLRATLDNAWENVALYRGRMQQAGVQPNDIRGLEDVARLPFTQKSDLRDHYPFGLFARPREALARLHASSGTAGSSSTSPSPLRPTAPGASR